TNVPVRASSRARCNRRSATRPSSSTGVRPKSVAHRTTITMLKTTEITSATGRSTAEAIPRPSTRKTYAASLLSSSEFRNLAAAEQVRHLPRARSAAGADRRGVVYLHQPKTARHDDGQDDQKLDDRLLIATLRSRQRVNPGDRQRDQARRDHGDQDGDRERA